MAEFVTPAFLQGCSTDDNHAKMRAIMPADIDLSAGNHGWNMTRPTALVMAEMCEFILPEVLKQILPEWSYGDFLEGHAKSRNLTRRAATAASGELTITGDAGTVIPTGSLFSTASVNEEASVDYATTESATIPESGVVVIPIQCTKTGTTGNTAANTIVLVSSKNNGISSVTNEEAVTGGTEQESDESLRERVQEHDRTIGNSYTGNISDYKRWATSVPGVGEATIIPAQDTSGLVQIILTDSNGDPATDTLCEEVYNYIMRPDDPDKRLAPINASLSVAPPATIEIGVSATVELEEAATIEAVKTAFASNLAAYLPTAFADGEIKYTRIAAVLTATDGVNDHSNLRIGVKTGNTVGYSTSNISISSAQLPSISESDLVLTAGTV